MELNDWLRKECQELREDYPEYKMALIFVPDILEEAIREYPDEDVDMIEQSLQKIMKEVYQIY